MEYMSKFCSQCGTENKDTAKFCQQCGNPLKETKENQTQNLDNTIIKKETTENKQENNTYENNPNTIIVKKKDPLIAALLSFLIIGAGYLYIDDTKKFLKYFLIGILLAFITIFTMGIGLIAYLPFYIYQIYDAYKSTEQYNQITY